MKPALIVDSPAEKGVPLSGSRLLQPTERNGLSFASRNGAANPPLRVGLFGIGHEAYWPQFKGLKKRLEGYLQVMGKRLVRPGVEVVNLGMVDSPAKALEAGHRFRRE